MQVGNIETEKVISIENNKTITIKDYWIKKILPKL